MLQIEAAGERDAKGTDTKQYTRSEDREEDHLNRCGAPYCWPGKEPNLQLESNREQEQVHADLGKSLDTGGGLEPECMEHESRYQIPNERGKMDSGCKQSEGIGNEDQGDIHCASRYRNFRKRG